MAQSTPKNPWSAKLLPIAAAGALALVLLALRCGHAEDVGSGPNVGAVSVKSTSTGSEGIDHVTYRITGNDIAPLTGTSPLAQGAAAFVVKEIPAGLAYVITLTATARDGATRCQQRATFDITAERMTPLEVSLPCVRPGAFRTGTAGEGEAEAPPEVVASPECAACEAENIKSGKCEPDSGCDGLDAADKKLCLDLVACARRTACWVKRPLDCLCGTAGGVDCAKGEANGDCRLEMQAATKTTDPIKNGTLMFDPSYPAGRAMRLVACDFDNCQSTCGPK